VYIDCTQERSASRKHFGYSHIPQRFARVVNDLIALVHAVDPQVPGPVMGRRGAAGADGDRHRTSLGLQQVGHRDRGQTLVVRIAK
jgi:hypothetical protein